MRSLFLSLPAVFATALLLAAINPARAEILKPLPRPETLIARKAPDVKPAVEPTVPPEIQEAALTKKEPVKKHPHAVGDDEDTPAPAADVDEALPLPEYPMGARISTGKMQSYAVGEEDTLLDIARHFSLGFVEVRAHIPYLSLLV